MYASVRSSRGRVKIWSVGPNSTSSPEIEESGVIGHARGLLQVVRDDDDRQLLLQLVDQLLDLLRRDRVERAGRLVEQQHLRLVGERARDAKALLLPAGETERRCAKPVLHFVPERRAAQRPLHDRIDRFRVGNAVDAGAVGDVVVDRLREMDSSAGTPFPRAAAARPRRATARRYYCRRARDRLRAGSRESGRSAG